MIAKIIAALSAFIISVISAGGYLGIALLMAIESACIPLPSEIIMPFSGYLVYVGRFKLLWVATVGALGCNLGSAVAYAVGYYGGRPLVEKYGSYILLSRHELDWADRFFARYGNITVFVSRLLPVVRTFIGSWPWCLGLAYVGMKLGQRWDTDPRLRIWFHRFDAVILAVILIGIVVFVWTRWQGRIRAGDPLQNGGL